jgi:hypothetical protein
MSFPIFTCLSFQAHFPESSREISKDEVAVAGGVSLWGEAIRVYPLRALRHFSLSSRRQYVPATYSWALEGFVGVAGKLVQEVLLHLKGVPADS